MDGHVQHAHEAQVEVGLRLAPLSTNASAFARDLLEELDREGPQRTIIGLGAEGSRLIIVLSVALGSAEAVRAGDDCAREAVVYLDDFVQRRAAWDPALIGMPDSGSPDAIIAEHVRTQARAYGLGEGAVLVERKALKQAIHALAGIGVAGRA